MRRPSTRRGLLAAGTAHLAPVTGCQGLFGVGDEEERTGEDGGESARE